jgi:hypothetical protein
MSPPAHNWLLVAADVSVAELHSWATVTFNGQSCIDERAFPERRHYRTHCCGRSGGYHVENLKPFGMAEFSDAISMSRDLGIFAVRFTNHRRNRPLSPVGIISACSALRMHSAVLQ